MTISGTFEVGSAQIEDTLLVITDKTGTRKIRLGDLENAKQAAINGTTIAEWLSSAGIDFNNLTTSNYSDGKVIGSSSGKSSKLLGEVSDEDGDGRTAIDPDWKPSPEPVSPTTPETVSDPTKGELFGSANTRGGNGTVSIDLKDVDAAQENVTVNDQTVGTLSNSYPNATTFTRNGLTIHLLGVSSSTSGKPTENGASLITPKTFDELTEDQKTIIAGLFKWWGKECLKINEDSYDLGFNSSTTMVKDIGLYFFDGDAKCDTLATVWNWQRNTTDGVATQLMLNVNMSYYNGLDPNDVDGATSKGGAGFLDRTLAHEFNHAVFAANVNYFNAMPKFIKEGIAELTHGIDDERGNVIFHIAYDDNWLTNSLALSDTGTGSQDNGDGYAGGFMFWRYLAKQAAAQTLPAFGSITVDVDFNALTNLAAGNILYIDTTQTNPTVQVAENEAALNELDDNCAALGEIVVDGGVTFYNVYNDLFKQNITMGGQIAEIHGVNSNVKVIGSDSNDAVQIVEGATEVNTGGGADIVQITGQYAKVNTGAGDDEVLIIDGSHHSIDLGDGENFVAFQSTNNFGNVITGGANGDTVRDFFTYYVDANNNAYPTSAVTQGEDGKLYATVEDKTQVEVTEAPHYYYDNAIDLGDGNNQVSFYYGEGNTITTGAGDDTINVGGGTGNVVNTGDGADHVEVLGNKHLIHSGDGADTVYVYGANTTVFGDEGDDLIYQYSNSDGGNFYAYNAAFGNDEIRGFKANDKILLADTFKYTVADETINYNDGTTGTNKVITVTDGTGNALGTITVTNPESFDETTNIALSLKAESVTEDVTNEIDVTERGQTVTLTDAADVIYVDISQVAQFQLDGTFGANDKIIFYSVDKSSIVTDYTVSFRPNLYVYINDNFHVDITGGGFYSAQWSEVVDTGATATVTNYGATTDSNGALVRGEKSEQTFTLTGLATTDGITYANGTFYIGDNNINGEQGTVTVTGDAQLKYTGNHRSEDNWSLDEETGVASYTTAENTAGYRDGESITWYTPQDTSPAVQLQGITDNDKVSTAVTEDGKFVNINKATKGTVKVLKNDGYIFELDGDGYTFTGGDADTILIYGSLITVKGGAGNDNIYNYYKTNLRGEVTFDYTVGDGDDTIYGFIESSTLRLFNADGTKATYIKEVDGDDVVITVGGGTIRLERVGKL